MSTHAASVPEGLPAQTHSAAQPASISSNATKALGIGLAGSVLTALGLFIDGSQEVAYSWLVGVMFWTAIAIGCLLMITIHHIFDAKWSVVLRRQLEHGLATFKWLALLFVPLVLASILGPRDVVWPWMDSGHVLHGHGTVGTDLLYAKKAGFLNLDTFVIMTAVFFLSWIVLSYFLRKASFTQDLDGDPKWTTLNRKLSAGGIPLAALTLTFASIYWIKSLEYHWFSTMYGVWFFANCYRGALSLSVIVMVWLYNRGDYKGILTTDHMHAVGQVMLALTIFWGYVTFSQYFLIWNANVPEETFWYNIREINHDGTPNQWKYVGIIAILFGHFVVPFCLLLSYRFKVTHRIIRRIAYWILGTIVVDLCYNILPAMKDPATGDPLPFFSLHLVWVLTSVIGVGGICAWAYLKSFSTTKLIPIRDPRIVECLTHHE
jgi:hypothetical protein